MYAEDDLFPISAIQHVLFCERQFALIHLEQIWEENVYTAEGRVLHERVDEEHHESRGLFLTEYGMALRSLKFGIVGKADVVEFEKGSDGRYVNIKPVEFKRGKNKVEDWDRVQLCAQAFCLEEMFRVSIVEGQIFYFQEHRRTTVAFDTELRGKTNLLIERIREIMDSGLTPQPVYSRTKCDRCSLVEVCMPKYFHGGKRSALRYVRTQVKASFEDSEE